MQFSELKEMKSSKSNNTKQKYEKVSQNDDKSEIVIFDSNNIKISVSLSLIRKFIINKFLAIFELQEHKQLDKSLLKTYTNLLTTQVKMKYNESTTLLRKN